MMNQLVTFRHLAVAGFACLLASSCSDVTDDGTTLPPGTYPMTFTASVDGMTVSRVTTTDGKTAWQENDPVAISMDGGANYKQYKISNANTGAMVPNDGANTLYWSKQRETLAAWYPVSCTVGSNTGNGKVNITDQNTSFGTLENILHAPAQDYTYSSGGSVAFVFRHALSKVKVTLQKGDGIEESDLSGATVTFMGYTTGSLGYDGMTGSGDNSNITPKTETTDGVTTYTALLIPQQMQGKKFIKVTVGGKDYYYTPKGMENGNLRAGYVDNYTITVKQNELSVVWQKGEQIDITPEEASFQIHLNDFTAPDHTSNYSVTDANGSALTHSGGVYTLTGNELNISLTVDPNYLLQNFSVNVKDGICTSRMKYAAGTRTYTYTFNVRSDLWLHDVEATLMPSIDYGSVSVGDYFYSDGTYSSGLGDNNGKTCIGIVFEVNAGQDDNANKYNPGFVGGTIHGYVLALQDAASAPCRWGIRPANTGISRNTSNYDGYSNTQKAIALNQSKYEAFIQAAQYSMDTPMLSSSWYLPSYAQWNAIFTEYRKNGTFSSNLQSAGGSFTNNNDGYYWTSTESNDYDAHCAKTKEYGFATSPKDNSNDTYHASYVRAILTF